MAAVAVVHMDLMAKGGGESVAMTVLEALQDDHDVTLLTLTHPDLEELNAYFNTDVRSIDIELAGRLAPGLHRRYGLKYYILQNALLSRYTRERASEFDLLISTINELGLAPGSIEYIHFPFDWNVGLNGELREKIFHPMVQEDGIYERLCTAIAGITTETVTQSTLLANSAWTASAVEGAYGVKPEVVFPPVDTSGFVDRKWDERESGFVTIGRIERSKRVHELIRIIDAVRDRGFDTHLHIIGPTIDSEYCAEIESMAIDRPHIHLEGELSRESLIDRICSHRFGIHGKRHEHFGMAVAELAAGGTIPFVPETGGPSAIIDDQSELQYASFDDAVDKIAAVLSDRSLQSDLRTSPSSIRRRFGRKRFKNSVTEIVSEALDEQDSVAPELSSTVPISTD